MDGASEFLLLWKVGQNKVRDSCDSHRSRKFFFFFYKFNDDTLRESLPDGHASSVWVKTLDKTAEP